MVRLVRPNHEFSMFTVTTVIPVRDRKQFIARALESVTLQTCPPTEVIVVDDASTDETPNIVAEIAKKLNNLVLIKLPKNVGAAQARNIGAENAKGNLLAFLDSDDRWYPEKLEKQINEFRAYKDIVAVFCGSLETTDSSSLRYIPPADARLNSAAGCWQSAEHWQRFALGLCTLADPRFAADVSHRHSVRILLQNKSLLRIRKLRGPSSLFAPPSQGIGAEDLQPETIQFCGSEHSLYRYDVYKPTCFILYSLDARKM
jgi:glycosyltransferase involved in cell wall biosynthesis